MTIFLTIKEDHEIGDLVAAPERIKNIIGIISDKWQDPNNGMTYKIFWNDATVADMHYEKWAISSLKSYLVDLLNE